MARDYRLTVWTACAVVFFLALVGSGLLANLLMKPIDRIMAMSVRLAQGDVSQIGEGELLGGGR